MADLKPCPFCGGEARHYAPCPIDHHIECVECYADIHRDTEAEAIAAWNSRAERTCRNTQSDFDFMCSECGKCVDNGRVMRFNYCPKCGRKVEA